MQLDNENRFYFWCKLLLLQLDYDMSGSAARSIKNLIDSDIFFPRNFKKKFLKAKTFTIAIKLKLQTSFNYVLKLTNNSSPGRW